MLKKSKPLKNGEAMREFYGSIKIIEEHFNDKGYKKQTLLYRHLKDKLSWKMSIESFKYHFKKHIVNDCFLVNPKIDTKQKETPKKEHDIIPSSPIIKKTSNDDGEGPIIARPNFSKAPKFNPHTGEIDRSRII